MSRFIIGGTDHVISYRPGLSGKNPLIDYVALFIRRLCFYSVFLFAYARLQIFQ